MQDLINSIDFLQTDDIPNNNIKYNNDEVAYFNNENKNLSITTVQILEYIKQRKNSIKEVYCKQIVDDDAVVQLIEFWKKNYDVFHLRRLLLPKNNITIISIQTITTMIQSPSSLLVELDLSENPDVFHNDETGLQLLTEALSMDTCRITHLNLSKNSIGNKGSNALSLLLKRNSSITNLGLSHNSIGPRCIMAVAKSLCHNKTIQSLDLSYNKIGDRGVCRLMAALDEEVSECKLNELNLSFNKINATGAEHIATLLSGNNRYITNLNLSLNVIGPEGAECFGSVLQYNHVLENLNLSRNNIGNGVVALANGLQLSECSHLKRLDLSWNSLTNDGAKHLADVLRKNSALESLKLASNAIGDEGLYYLAEALHSDLALKELDLVGNQICDPTGLIHLICHGSYKLQKLSYEKNHLSPLQEARMQNAFQFRENKRTWLAKLLRDISQNHYVSLNLKSKDFGDEEIITLTKALSKNKPTVTTAFLYSSRLSDRGIGLFARDVLGNSSAAPVQRLYVRGCTQLTARGIGAIARAVSTNHCQLTCLSLTGCNIGIQGAQLLSKCFENNVNLRRVDLQSNKIGDLGAQTILASVLDPPHPKLVSLNLAANHLSDKAVSRIGRLNQLEDLHLDDNYITDYGALDIAKAVMGSESIRWLNMKGNCLSSKGIKALNLFLRNEFILECSEQRESQTNGNGNRRDH